MTSTGLLMEAWRNKIQTIYSLRLYLFLMFEPARRIRKIGRVKVNDTKRRKMMFVRKEFIKK